MDPNNNPTPINESAATPESPMPDLTTAPDQAAEGVVVAGAATVNNATGAINNAVNSVASNVTGAVGATTPVNPVINPTNPSVNPLATNQGVASDGLAATDPIMMREPAKTPDPVEEELKAPMKAAEPVPGSIGSAVSGPAEGMVGAPDTNPFAAPEASGAQTPNVSFNDPAVQPDGVMPGGMGVSSAKKKTSKNTLIALIAVAAMIVISLAAILIIQLMNNNSSPAQSGVNSPVVITPDEDDDDTNSNIVANNTLSCVRNMTVAEAAQHNDVVSGTITVSAVFGNDNILSNIAVIESVVFDDEDATSNEPVENVVHESKAEDLTSASALNYFLPVDDSGAVNLNRSAIQANYESLDFVCEVL